MNDSPFFQFHYELDDFQLDNESLIELWLIEAVKKENESVDEIRYVFLDDESLLQVNREFLGHDYYTDIITFPMHDVDQPFEADIFISVDRVKDNAKEYGFSFKEELLRVMAHGFLHLCGYDDKNDEDAKIMRTKEQEYIDLYRQIKRST